MSFIFINILSNPILSKFHQIIVFHSTFKFQQKNNIFFIGSQTSLQLKERLLLSSVHVYVLPKRLLLTKVTGS